MFKEVRALFARYSAKLRGDGRRCDAAVPTFEPEYLIEAQQRLEQLQFIVGRIRSLGEPNGPSSLWATARHEAQLRDAPHLRAAEHAEHMSQYRSHLEEIAPAVVNSLEMQVLAEAFYYIAWRAIQVLRKLPGLTSLRSVGIRSVRNHLLEHPEGRDSGVIENGYSWDRSTGPVIKGVRRSDKVNIFPDAGLYANAHELASNLQENLERFVVRR